MPLHCDADTMSELVSWSRAQTPPSHKEKSLVIVEQFLSCAESAVLIDNPSVCA